MQTSKVRASHEEWNYQVAQDLGLLQRPALALPSWDRRGEDPLEEIVHPSPEDPVVYYGLPLRELLDSSERLAKVTPSTSEPSMACIWTYRGDRPDVCRVRLVAGELQLG